MTIDEYQKFHEITDGGMTNIENTSQEDQEYFADSSVKPKYSKRIFDMAPSFDYFTNPVIALGIFVGIVLLAEFLRRLFYYIYFGAWYPKD